MCRCGQPLSVDLQGPALQWPADDQAFSYDARIELPRNRITLRGKPAEYAIHPVDYVVDFDPAEGFRPKVDGCCGYQRVPLFCPRCGSHVGYGHFDCTDVRRLALKPNMTRRGYLSHRRVQRLGNAGAMASVRKREFEGIGMEPSPSRSKDQIKE
ncbi:hypothetical protein [Ferrimonas marina]|uniref:hypothetical protein n=1 Tax=Ferrimonas marina TaxID=299255 RepID=UPI000831DB98|nr:hypothetical protein [Ferrimonas marina]